MILRIFAVWYRLAPFVIAFLRDRRRWILAGPPRFVSAETHRERARQLTRVIASLGPSFIKLAQVFGIRADIIPSTRTIIDECSRVIAEEMDFHHEADNVERFGDLFRNSDFVIIPPVYREVTTTRVLVMQFFEGFRVTEVDEILRHNVDTQK